MTEITLNAKYLKSVIHCGAGSFEAYAPKLRDRQLFIVTDKNVFALYRRLMWDTFGDNAHIKILPAGENSKTQRYLFEILQAMAEADMKRSCTVVAFGGGVVGDIAGLAASLYMRGVRLVQIPTTLLSQVDSSVGGKTAVDFKKIKNLIGTFYQPEEVIVDPRFLETLPKREIRCGLGEIIKYGALDKQIYTWLTDNADKLFDLDFLGSVTASCIRCKARIAEGDERDLNGLRKTLNLGHTTGHALELFYGRKSHGEFVLIGAYYEMFIAKASGVGGGTYFDNLASLIKCVIHKIPAYENIEEAARLAVYDKKNVASGSISLIVPKREGECEELVLGTEEYVRLICACRDSLKDVNL